MPAVDNFKSVSGGLQEKHWAEVGSVCSAQARQEKQRIKIIIEKKGNFLVKAVPLLELPYWGFHCEENLKAKTEQPWW